MADALPHDHYMDFVAHQLAAYGIEPGRCWTETPDGLQLDAVFLDWPAGTVNAEHWPHDVALAWDQNRGWMLIEQGGGRTVWPLSKDSGTYTHPRQIAADTMTRLYRGMDDYYSPGPVTIAGPRWDGQAVHEAVTAWEAAE